MTYSVANAGKNANDQGAGDISLFLKLFAGETLAAYARTSKTAGKHLEISIKGGKSAQFPVMGRGVAKFLKPGQELTGQEFEHTEKVIAIDGLLTADVFVSDLYEALSQDAFRSMYSTQLGESLAIAKDQHVLAEIAKLVEADKENLRGLGKPTKVKIGELADLAAFGEAFIDGMLGIAAELDQKYVPASERYGYIQPATKAKLVKFLSTSGKDFAGTAYLSQWGDVTIAGIPLIVVPHLGDSGIDFTNALNTEGHKFPVSLAGKVAALVAHKGAVGTVNLMSMAFETQRYSTRQATHLVAKMATGHGGLRPEAAAAITTEAAATFSMDAPVSRKAK